MKDRQEEAAVERAPFTEFSILNIIFGRHTSRLYIDFLSLPSRRPRCERFRVNVAKTPVPGAHQESISIDEGQLIFCPASSYIQSPRGIASGEGRTPLGWRSTAFSRSPRTKSGLVTSLTILTRLTKRFFLRCDPNVIPSDRDRADNLTLFSIVTFDPMPCG